MKMPTAQREQHHDYQVVPYPKLRRALAVTLSSARRKPMIHGLLEVDVTKAREMLEAHKAETGESLSFTAFIITCLAKAVEENTSVQAYRKGSKHLVVFDGVDVATAIEREMAGQKQPIIYIIRDANTKNFRQVHQEIRAAQVNAVEQSWQGLKDFGWLPLLAFRLFWPVFWWLKSRSPAVQKKYGGTVGVSAVGMFGKGAGWGIPVNDHTVDLTVGGVAETPTLVDGQIVTRLSLCLTLSFNHAIVDGAPAARFTGRLKSLIESGYGLYEQEGGQVAAVPTPETSSGQ